MAADYDTFQRSDSHKKHMRCHHKKRLAYREYLQNKFQIAEVDVVIRVQGSGIRN